jgi:hypothetical protein
MVTSSTSGYRVFRASKVSQREARANLSFDCGIPHYGARGAVTLLMLQAEVADLWTISAE